MLKSHAGGENELFSFSKLVDVAAINPLSRNSNYRCIEQLSNNAD